MQLGNSMRPPAKRPNRQLSSSPVGAVRREYGSILVGLLWCVTLLAVVVISALHTARMDLMVVKNYGDKIQARYLALAGIEKAKALLYQNARDRSRTGKNHTGELYNAPEQFRDVAFGRGQFRVFRRARPDEGGGVLYGISDEESRLNLNIAASDQLTNLAGLTPEIAAAILAWRGENGTANPAGADADYYAAQQPPYQPRHGRFQTIRELLMVRGVSPDLLLRDDPHQNGGLETGGAAPENSAMPDGGSGGVDAGWAGNLTVDSTDNEQSAAGQDRVNIQNADLAALTGVRGITPAIAQAILAYRNQNRFHSIADLLDVSRPANNQNQNPSAGNAPADQSAPANSGPKVIDENLFLDIADDVTVDTGANQAGLINLNTAGLDVLTCLPGVTRELAQAIIAYRQSNGFFANVAWLLKVDGMTRDLFKQIAPLVTARSETFRILSEGRINSTGTRQRIQMIVHVGLDEVTTLSYREDDL